MNFFYDQDDVLTRTSQTRDLAPIAARMRESDRLEVMASHGHAPYEAVKFAFSSSPVCMTILYKNEPVAMFGVVGYPMCPGTATVWLLGTNGIYKMRKSFLRLSRRYIAEMLKEYPTLYNFVDARNRVTVRWLEWCGATFNMPIAYGVAGLPFRAFVIQAKEGVSLV